MRSSRSWRAPTTSTQLHSPVPTRMVSNGEHMPIPQTTEQKQVERRIEDLAESVGRRLGLGRRRFLAGAGGVAASFLAMNEVYGQFFSVDRDELYQPDAALPNAPPADLFVFDDQLHMVRSSQSGPLLFLAFVQGESAAAGSPFKKNPFQKEGQVDELGRPWSALDPKRAGVAINGESLHLSRFIQDVYFDSQVTVGLLSAATLGVFPPGDPNGRPPQNYTESQQVVNVTARQTVAVRNFVNRISGSQRMLAHGQIYPGRSQPRVHGAADPGEPSRLVEGLQHRLRRESRRRSDQPDAPLAPRRREGRLSDLRADRTPQGAARQAPRLLQHLHPQGLLALARRHARDGQPDRHPEGVARLAAVHLHHLPRVLGRHGAVRLVASGARRHPRRAQLPERRAEPALADAVRPDLRPAAQRGRRDRLDLRQQRRHLADGLRPHARAAA